MVSGANTDGGLVAAEASEWNEVSTIQTTGSTKRMPTTQASRDSQTLAPSRRFLTGRPRSSRVAGTGPVSVMVLIACLRSAHRRSSAVVVRVVASPLRSSAGLLPEQRRDRAERERRDDDGADDHDDRGRGGPPVVVGVVEDRVDGERQVRRAEAAGSDGEHGVEVL